MTKDFQTAGRGRRRWLPYVGAATTLLIVLAVGPPRPAVAMPGPLRPDLEFGSAGIVRPDPGFRLGGTEVAIDSRRRILIGGLNESTTGPRAAAVLRFLPDGRPDRAFGHSGRVRLEGFWQDGMVPDRSGGAYVLTTDVRDRDVIVHLDDDGRPERRFGTRGRVRLALSSQIKNEVELNHPLVTLPGGGLVVAGLGGDRRERFEHRGPPELRRLSSGGHLVRRFGRDGVVELDDARLRRFVIRDMSPSADGGILIAGAMPPPRRRIELHRSVADRQLVVVELDRGGHLDRRFGRGGIATPLIAGSTSARVVLGAPDGSIFVAADHGRRNRRDPDHVYHRALLLRLGPDGRVARRFAEVKTHGYEGGSQAAILAASMSGMTVAAGRVLIASGDGNGEFPAYSLLAYPFDHRPGRYLRFEASGLEGIDGLASRGRSLFVLGTTSTKSSPFSFRSVLLGLRAGG